MKSITERIVTGAEMKRLDERTIKEHGVPSLVLMERAALASVEVLHEEGFDLNYVDVFCGPGNNGGDGIAVARLLFLAGKDVTIIFVGDPEKRSADTIKQQEIAESYGLKAVPFRKELNRLPEDYSSVQNDPAQAGSPYATLADDRPGTIVDAIFGIGSIRAPAGDFLEAIRYINERKKHGTKILSLDVPSGVCADTGNVPGEAVTADVTVTFAYKKTGLTLPPGVSYAGKIIVKDIGIYI